MARFKLLVFHEHGDQSWHIEREWVTDANPKMDDLVFIGSADVVITYLRHHIDDLVII